MLGATLAYIVLRTRLPGRRLVEQMAMAAVAVPGLVLGIGLLRTYYDVKLPSGEVRKIFIECLATVGQVGNLDHENVSIGKAGRSRWLGRRPHVRGMAMNPVDHPNGGGQGKSKGGGGRQQLVSPWGQLAKGFPTRRRSKPSNASIIVHHNGRKPRGQK